MSNRKSETVNPEGPVMADEAKVGGRYPMVPVFHHGPIPSFHYSSIPLFRSRDPEQRSTKETPYGVTTSGVQCAKQSQFGHRHVAANCGWRKWLREQEADCACAKTKPNSTRSLKCKVGSSKWRHRTSHFKLHTLHSRATGTRRRYERGRCAKQSQFSGGTSDSKCGSGQEL